MESHILQAEPSCAEALELGSGPYFENMHMHLRLTMNKEFVFFSDIIMISS